MNEYGYFIYDNFPLNAQADITPHFDAQDGSSDIVLFENDNWATGRSTYYDFASFEPGGFDFEKPIFVYDPQAKMAYTSEDFLPDIEHPYIVVYPTGTYDGTGFTLRTYMNDYRIQIIVTDVSGTRSETFYKTDDEFYYFPFEGLHSASIYFLNVEENHFIKVLGIKLGTTRYLSEKDFAELPELINNFSLTNEALEYDTLTLTVRGDKSYFKASNGERIIYSRTAQRFYIDNAIQNSNGTVTIVAYDDLSRLEKNYPGYLRSSTSTYITKAEDLVVAIAEAGISDIQATCEGQFLYTDQLCSGTISNDVTYREALRIMMQGNAMALKHTETGFEIFKPTDIVAPILFDETNIVGLPDIEELERYGLIHFSRHKYKVNKKDGEQELFNGELETDNAPFTIKFSEPFDIKSYNYVSGTTQQGEDILVEITSGDPNFVVTTDRPYYIKGRNDYVPRIVILGYPYDISYHEIERSVNVPKQYKDNEKEISDCTMAVKLTNYNPFRNFLEYIYSFYIRVTLTSLRNVTVGRKVAIKYDNEKFNGWILSKTNNLNGIYSYTIICKRGLG